MRVALHCPYSLSRPGGVQGQVTRWPGPFGRRGTRPSSSPPAEARRPSSASTLRLPAGALVVVGRSVAAAGQRLGGPARAVAGCRGPRRAGRARRAVRRRAPARAPGPGVGLRRLLGARVPKVGTFHRRATRPPTALLGPLARAGRRPARRCAARCRPRPRRRPRDALGGDYAIVPNAVELDRFADAEPWAGRQGEDRDRARSPCSSAGTRSARDSPSSSRHSAGSDRRVARRRPRCGSPGHGPDTEALAGRFPPRARADGGWEPSPTTSWRRACAAADVLCAPSLRGESFGVVLLEAMAARTAVVASDTARATRAVAGGHGDPGGARGRRRPGRARWATCSVDAAAGTGRCSAAALDAAAAHAARWSMPAQAARYVALYEEALARRDARGPMTRPPASGRRPGRRSA